MNPKLISSSRTKSLPNFPVLKVGNHRRCFSKHFTNLPLWLSADEVAMINWLCYRLSADNTFEHSTKLLNQYSMSILEARDEYKSVEYGLKTITTAARRCMRGLIEKGLILHTNKRGVFMVNPMLTYECDVVNKKAYNEIMEVYQSGDVDKVVELFSKLVSNFLQSKKKNYIYGRKK